MKQFLVFIVFGFAVVTVHAAGGADPAAGKSELRMGVAYSMSSLLDECITIYEKRNPGINITPVYGSSGSIRRQIENGAPLDIFFSASSDHMNALEEEGLIDSTTRRNILTNSLVLIVPKESGQSPSITDLESSSIARISVGEPSSVPAGKYAVQVLENAGVLEAVMKKAVYAKNVRQVLYYVESGEVDAGFVYMTETLQSSKVRITAVADERSHDAIIYPGAVLKDCGNRKAACDFLQWMRGEEAEAMFQKHGFEVP